MPVAPSILKAIKAVRKEMISPDPKDRHQLGLYGALRKLFQKSDEIAANLESIEALLDLAPEIEAFRGKGSQMAANDFARSMSYLGCRVMERLPRSESTPDLFPKKTEVPSSAKDVIDCLERLADHAFPRTQGPPVRSRHAGELRAFAWNALKRISEVLHRPEHLAHAHKVAADKRASIAERTAAEEYLSDFRDDDEEE